MDYYLDLDIDTCIKDESEPESWLEKKIEWFKKRSLIVKIIMIITGGIIIMAILGLIGALAYKIHSAFAGDHKEPIIRRDKPNSGSRSKTNNKFSINKCLVGGSSSTKSTINPLTEITNHLSESEINIVEDDTTLEIDESAFLPWKYFRDLFKWGGTNVNDIKKFAIQKGYLDENLKVTTLGKEMICIKNSINRGPYYAISEKFADEFQKEEIEPAIKSMTEYLESKGIAF